VAVKIRLKRLGKIRSPHYRIVVADSRTKRDGRVIEEIGRYIPTENPSFIEVNSERAQYWLSVGAQPTEQVTALLKLTGDYQASKGEKATNMVQVKAAKPEFVVDSAKKAVLLPKVEKKAPVVEAVVEEAPAADAEVAVEEVAEEAPAAEAEAEAPAEAAVEEVAEEAPAAEAEAEAPAEAAAEEVAEEAPAAEAEAEAEAEAPAEVVAEEVAEEAPAAEAEAPAEEA
jgi:small subunit ribosomal protein S16